MRHPIQFVLFLWTLDAVAQDWALLNPAYKYNYSNDGTDTISNQIFVTHVDTLGPDSFLYQLNRIGVVCDTCPASLGGPCDGCYVWVDQPQFLGLNCTRSGNDWFLNDLDTFLIKSAAGVGTTWIFEPNSGVTATVVSNLPGTVFGQPDTIRRIALTTGDTLVLTRSFGLLNFPRTGIRYDLLGVQGADVGVLFPDPLDYFDFQAGDELTYMFIRSYQVTPPGDPWFHLSHPDYWKVVITGRSDSPGSVTYSTSWARSYTSIPNAYVLNEPIWQMPYAEWLFTTSSIISDHPILGSYPGAVLDTSISWHSDATFSETRYLASFETTSTGRKAMLSRVFANVGGFAAGGFDLMNEIGDGLYPYNLYPINVRYEVGLGITRAQYFRVVGDEVRLDLVGAIISGDTVIHAPAIVWTVGLEEVAHSMFTLTPNPSNDSFSLTSAEVGATVRLHDIRGRLLRSVRITSERQLIDVADLHIGVYLVRVDDSVPQRLIVAR